MAVYRPCILIPCYNHARELQGFLPQVARNGVKIFVIDDGSNPEEALQIQRVCAHEDVELIKRSTNGGKWAAVTDGMKLAVSRGYTHTLQCDADGQHAAECIGRFLEISSQHPQSLILGTPKYGEDAPKARLYGRRITNFFVWLETAGACTYDAMCGFRIYPLPRAIAIINRYGIAPGMAGDIEFLVRCYWDGMPIISESVKVCYPEGGRSNFRMLRDNILISMAHTKLCIEALLHPWRLMKAHRPR